MKFNTHTVAFLDSWPQLFYTRDVLVRMLLSAHIITGECVVCYITSLFQKVISLCNMLLSVNLVANAILPHYIMHYVSNT